ncbi:MAG: hypothetical protein FD187_2960 [bacterium]|nr:MAG: hypothetical protein FD142_967 [bacterium]KAF0147237.1 MAG: hypothetical protein FD187_2960 [bacterium]KAF0168075.1 MAG: hypothetical protein FD158_1623 [bacterium]TXT17603.1 MAG: hypothetical protein FD132_2386 [bacterium]
MQTLRSSVHASPVRHATLPGVAAILAVALRSIHPDAPE